MRLSWNEIRVRAKAFSEDWKAARYEKGETQSFYNDFFEVFGVKRRQVGRYEEAVKDLKGNSQFIDLFWPGMLIVEQKSAGRDLSKAESQAFRYFDILKDNKQPRYIMVCDFQSFQLRDLAEREVLNFELKDLHKHVQKFGFMIGVERREFKDQDPVNIKAAELVGKLHDALEDSGGLSKADLEVFLVQIVFCLFADDTGVFQPKDVFLNFLEDRTAEDGSDLGEKLSKLFQTLDTAEANRAKHLDEDLAAFPYINGRLFERTTRIPSFDSDMREKLIEASRFDWSPISPAIFGALFQSVMDSKARRASGAHYTTEKNIQKVIGPLFMDGLWEELEKAKALKRGKNNALDALSTKLGTLTFFDPACGCGNFLIIAYRELRRLEIALLKERFPKGTTMSLDARDLSNIDVDQFYGIEIGEFPARIAETAMWMMDHIMNNELSLAFGQNFARIPLEKAANIVHGDALEVEWEDVLPAETCSYVFGNPPFIGHQWRTKTQQSQMHKVWGKKGQVNRLDYVTCWFKLAADYSNRYMHIGCAFVATNSISQGEQASILWPALFSESVTINFAHRTFQWESGARGKAAVHCVIIGFSRFPVTSKEIFEYDDIKGEPVRVEAKQINGYLIDAPHIYIPARNSAPEGMPHLFKGSQPTDGARLKRPDGGYITRSNLIMHEAEKQRVLKLEPSLEKWIRPFVGGDELISGDWRWCFWLKDAPPSIIKNSPELKERLQRVREGRLQSPTKSVNDASKYPTLFTQDRQPLDSYIGIPEVSSGTRQYLPIAFLSSDIIASNKLQIIPDAQLWLCAILSSETHMAWMRTITGRLKSDYSYSPTVYNTFPWPDLTEKAKATLTQTGQAILDARAAWPEATLADLYDPDAMPANLRKAHQANDKAVDRLYRKQPFESERERVEHLFMLYEKLQAPILAASKAKPRKRKARVVKTS